MTYPAATRVYTCWTLSAIHLLAGLLGLVPQGRINLLILAVLLAAFNAAVWRVMFINLPKIEESQAILVGKLARIIVIASIGLIALGIALLWISASINPAAIVVYFLISHSYAWSGFFIYSTAEWKAIKSSLQH